MTPWWGLIWDIKLVCSLIIATEGLQIFDCLLQVARNGLRRTVGGKPNWCSDAHHDSPRRRELAAGFLDFEQSIDPHRQDRNAEIVRKQAHSIAKCLQLAVFGMAAFRENEHAVAAVDGFSGVREALAESLLREGAETD